MDSDRSTMEGLRDRVPFRVCRVLHDAVVNPVALPLTKVLVVTAGWTNLTHRGRSVSLAEGDGAVPPTGALVGGEPLTEVETVTLYVDPEFLQQQIAWARLSTPIASTFNAAAQGAGQILALRPSPAERRAITSQARAIANHDSSAGVHASGRFAAIPGQANRCGHTDGFGDSEERGSGDRRRVPTRPCATLVNGEVESSSEPLYLAAHARIQLSVRCVTDAVTGATSRRRARRTAPDDELDRSRVRCGCRLA